MFDKRLLESKLEEISLFEKKCIDSLDENQKKEFDERKYRSEVLLEDIQQKKYRQKINRENIVSEKKRCEKDLLIYFGIFIIVGFLSFVFSDSSSLTFSSFVVLFGLYCIWRTNDRNFQYLCEFISTGITDSSIYSSETQLKLLGVDSVEVISKITDNEEKINNSYNHIGKLVKNNQEQIDLWNIEILIYKSKISLMILNRVDTSLSSLDTMKYTSVLFLHD